MLEQTSPLPPTPLSGSGQIQVLQQELERSNNSRNNFMVGMGHRIRTPLSGVMGMLELLASSALPEEFQHYAENALAASRSLMKEFDELLEFCRVEAGELVLVREEFSPAQVAADAMAEFSTESQDKGILLTTSVSPEVPSTIEGDPQRLRQVLHELIENALRFTTDGQVQVGVRPMTGSPTKLLYWVEDSGQGIDEDRLLDLFDFCFESEESDSITPGLPAARHIVEAMGGNIDVESDLGSGTTVRFSVPIIPTWESMPEGTESDVPCLELSKDDDRRMARVLVVEDDLVNQRVTLGYLKLVGYEGTVVDSGEAALRALAEEDFDLVLMDKMMPGMDGNETTRLVRAGEQNV
ncbi:MAG: K+-sensing histidine kinase KdpD, partial [Candidatus Paceibacteria bacterium]